MDDLSSTKNAAAEWLARRTGESWTSGDEARFDAWINASTGNRIAYLRLEAAWKDADRLKILGAGFEPGVVPQLEDFQTSPFFRYMPKEETPRQLPATLCDGPRSRLRALVPWLAAAAVLGATVGGIWMRQVSRLSTYETPTGVTAAVPLTDGSKITLNSDSGIRVLVTEKERRVNLDHGEAFFEVARDPSRPFTVQAGTKRIVVLGTKFSVRRDHDDVRVVVTEGVVALEQSGAKAIPPARLTAGTVARARERDVAIQERSSTEAEELLSWRSGYLVFHEASLAAAAAEFNRYNVRKIVITDPDLARISISGNFRSTNVDTFARLVRDGFAVQVDWQSDRIVLSKR